MNRTSIALLLFATLWTAPAAAQDAPGRGETRFQRCYSCHSVNPAETNLPGPNLAGIIGRRAAALNDFEYSRALRDAGQQGLVWDRATLDRFLADPMAVIPGTAMAFPGLKVDADREAVIGYLEARS